MDLSQHKLISIKEELLPLYNANPERFKRFYNAVYLLLSNIPEGGSIRVSEHCNPSSYSLFIKIACLCIREERLYKDVTDALLEFSDDYSEIKRSYKFIEATVWHHFYSRKRE